MTERPELVTVIVDDDENDRYLVRRYLGKREEFGTVLEAATGVEFLERICDGHALDGLPDRSILVLLDINMPRLNGFDTALALQERVDAGTVPESLVVMMFTSSDNPEDRRRADAIDIIRGYIVKPLEDADVSELLALWKAQ